MITVYTNIGGERLTWIQKLLQNSEIELVYENPVSAIGYRDITLDYYDNLHGYEIVRIGIPTKHKCDNSKGCWYFYNTTNPLCDRERNTKIKNLVASLIISANQLMKFNLLD